MINSDDLYGDYLSPPNPRDIEWDIGTEGIGPGAWLFFKENGELGKHGNYDCVKEALTVEWLIAWGFMPDIAPSSKTKLLYDLIAWDGEDKS